MAPEALIFAEGCGPSVDSRESTRVRVGQTASLGIEMLEHDVVWHELTIGQPEPSRDRADDAKPQ